MRPAPPETCAACRFDGSQYDRSDALGTLRALPVMWTQTLEGAPATTLTTRPEDRRWSAAEHLAHCADVAERTADLLGRALSSERVVLDEVPPDVLPVPGDASADHERLAAQLAAIAEAAAAVPARDRRWAAEVRTGDVVVDAAWLLRHAIHDGTHHLRDVGRALHDLGAGAPTQEGRVAQLNVSDGGVPKRPVEVADVGDRGVVGDRQATRKHHGRPLQALCLWSAEVIDALRAEGHPIGPGSAGENITVSGIDWATIRPGTQLLVGDVVIEISAWAVPCKKNARWFLGGDFGRMSHDRHPGWSRAYAWVREPGTVRQGDAVVVEP